MLKYTLARLGLFAACFGLIWLLGMRGRDQQLLLLLLAAVSSMALSFVLLRPMREQLSDQINERVTASMAAHAERRAQAEPGEDELAEDDELDELDERLDADEDDLDEADGPRLPSRGRRQPEA
ncbi:MAG TPA: DUF4229 domain-containing protein [Dermatophilaceae bacterium]|nr:DUF4229 domain-containing protein [Dermatophilaceae bacterium]